LSDPADLLELPPSDECWLSWVVRADLFESPNTEWTPIKDFPGLHEVGKTGDGRFYEIAIRESYMPWLLRFQHEPVKGITELRNILQPTNREINEDGQLRAIEKVKSRFLQAAGRGLSAGLGRGLDSFYRHTTRP
jgi:hypothetical protein